jgi:hypothetical protein
MGPRPKLCPKNENHWPAASDAMFDHLKELHGGQTFYLTDDDGDFYSVTLAFRQTIG